MSTLRTSNPLLTEGVFEPIRGLGNLEHAAARSDFMTVQGAARATLALLAVCALSGAFCWTYLQANAALLWPVTLSASLLALVLTVVCSFSKPASAYLAFPIAVCEGAFAGGVSIFWSAYAAHEGGTVGELSTGLVLQASVLTLGIAACVAISYSTRLFRVGSTFRLAVVAATGGIALVSLLSFVAALFGVNIPYLWGNGPIGIGFAGFIVVIAAMNLALDFDFIERGAENNLPRHMNWYAAVGVLVTLVWLYVSILRLLAKLSSRR